MGVVSSATAAAVVMIPVGVRVRAVGALSGVVVMVEIPLQMGRQRGLAFSTTQKIPVIAEGIQHIRQALGALAVVLVPTARVVTGIDARRQQVALGVRHVVSVVGRIAGGLLLVRGGWRRRHVLVVVLCIALCRMALGVSWLLALEVVLVLRMMRRVVRGLSRMLVLRVGHVLHVRVMPLVVGQLGDGAAQPCAQLLRTIAS